MKEEKIENGIYFAIHDFKCDVRVIAEVMQIDDYRGWSKGDTKPYRKDVICKTGLWEIKSPLAKNVGVENHVNWILNLLLPRVGKLRMIYQNYNASSELSISISTYNLVNHGIHLTGELIEKIHMLEASIDIDVYNL